MDGKHGTSFITPTSRYITKLHGEIPRRKFHANVFGSLLGGEIVSLGNANIEDANDVVTKTKTLVDVPMVRLSLPKGGFGREYIALKMKIWIQD